ncbi:Flp family type IVb pilin [Phytopseudomonas dryadis]|uniref:Flp family type IVb pilin n=1 Tax=Phytopseudomonas dryadis TaxID=2487520 RepID=A0A4Q9R0C7_9GAMM|nr:MULTISPECIES: Flp family type IVb pilin [Pseudomonas]TBU92101.1 Flp family type IVb pilin [Pseudomonas dryadis]TBV05040.1 Flp family type IVb pilin [Pseudomonas dryadis]TBV16443.1 Flp family type IVb pilin [Pseudomonas sp. FRB 230]
MIKLIMLRERIRDFLTREDGASAIEYSIIAALIGVVIVGAATALGNDISAVFESISDSLTGALGGGGEG